MNVSHDEFFRQAALRICGSLDIDDALAGCYEYVRNYIPVAGIRLSVIDPNLKVLKVVAQHPLDVAGEDYKIVPIPDLDMNEFEEDWRKTDFLKVINQPELDPKIVEFTEKTGRSLDFSLLLMLLELEGRFIGELGFYNDQTNSFGPEHVELFKLLREPMAITLTNALKHQELIRLKDALVDDNRFYQRQIRELSGSEIVGAEFGLRDVMNLIRQVAPMDSPVLLLGETGVGKDVLAHAIHRFSLRSEGPFIKVNCGALPETLVDSELFGHEKGAFTGAASQKRGRFERADGGTIFLDEIGELSLAVQVKLLNVIQNREIERLGGGKPVPVNIRIISATHRNLEEMVDKGKFREDLWFRLNVFPINVPPLRHRKIDIPALVHFFIENKSLDFKLKETPVLPEGAIDQLLGYDWPGNVRELENVVERAIIRSRGRDMVFDQLNGMPQKNNGSAESQAPDADAVLPLDHIVAHHIKFALSRTNGKISGPGGAAELLKIQPNTLRKKMDKLKIPYRRRQRAAGTI